jgi:signal transduction histidine kinase
VLEYAGLAPALRSHCDEVGRLTGLSCRVDFEDEALVLPPEVALGAYRVAQEALRNVVRHAAAAEARVAVTHHDGELRLTVRDDGAGFAAGWWGRPPGLGLVSMEERVRLLGGTLRVRSRPGAGTEVVACIPLGD